MHPIRRVIRLTALSLASAASLTCLGDSTGPTNPLGSGRTASVSITGPSSVRQGDVVSYSAQVTDTSGAAVADAQLNWVVEPASDGFFASDGRFVGYSLGTVRIVASLDGIWDTLAVTVDPRNGPVGSLAVVGQGTRDDIFSSDLWLNGTVGYTGTWGGRTVNNVTRFGNQLYSWDLSSPTQPVLVDSVEIDARVVNDIKIRADGAIAIITHEASNDLQNGVTLLDLSDPLHPQITTRFTQQLEPGVHNAWLEGDFAYLVVDGVGGGLRVLDISNPAQPVVVAEFYAGSSFLHDIYVRDGLAFLSHWDAGLVILDVGNGMAGGSPTDPVEVSRVATQGGQTHNAWYWPQAGYVFVGEEDFGTPGIMHVVDVRDMNSPFEVATFTVDGTTPHNFWLDEANAVLYLAWYAQGILAVDVSGELLGALDRQERGIASLRYGGPGGCPDDTSSATCTWAPQFHNGFVYVTDMNSGLWVLEPQF